MFGAGTSSASISLVKLNRMVDAQRQWLQTLRESYLCSGCWATALSAWNDALSARTQLADHRTKLADHVIDSAARGIRTIVKRNVLLDLWAWLLKLPETSEGKRSRSACYFESLCTVESLGIDFQIATGSKFLRSGALSRF